MLLESIRTLVQWLAFDQRRAEIARLMRGYPPRPPRISVIAWITIVGTSLVALALFIPGEAPFAASAVPPLAYTISFRPPPPYSRFARPTLRPEVTIVSWPSRATATITSRGWTRTCTTPCQSILVADGDVRVRVEHAGFAPWETLVAASGGQVIRAHLTRAP